MPCLLQTFPAFFPTAASRPQCGSFLHFRWPFRFSVGGMTWQKWTGNFNFDKFFGKPIRLVGLLCTTKRRQDKYYTKHSCLPLHYGKHFVLSGWRQNRYCDSTSNKSCTRLEGFIYSRNKCEYAQDPLQLVIGFRRTSQISGQRFADPNVVPIIKCFSKSAH